MPTVVLGDARVVFDELGAGEPILLLHGFPATRRLWSQIAPRLAEAGHRVVAPDLIGYGESEPAAGVGTGMGNQARWMLELLDRLGIQRTTVAAHDVGTAAAQLMLVRAPERIRALALMDGVYGGEWAMEAVGSIQRWEAGHAAPPRNGARAPARKGNARDCCRLRGRRRRSSTHQGGARS